MRTIYRLKQSTSNFKNHFVRDSKVIVAGTLFMFMLFSIVNVSAVSYKIVYDDNVVSGMPEDVKSTTMNDSEKISSDKPTRDGYSFLKWCTQVPASDGTCPGTEYDAGAALSIIGTSKNEYRLYAMWEEEEDDTMQSVTSAKLAALMPNIGDTTTLTDARDSQAYTIAKLADGKYWMIENLNLAGGSALSADDTDFEPAYTLPTTNGWTVSGGKLVMPASSTSGFATDNYAYVYNSGNKTNCGASGQNTPCYSYYSWDAATLGSGRSLSTTDTDAAYSICPKGWKLPTSRSSTTGNSDLYQLAVAYGMDSGSVAQSTPNFYNNAGPGTTPDFLLAGAYYSGQLYDGGSTGYYYSSTSGSNGNNARNIYFENNIVNSSNDYNRYLGLSVRCIFSE